MATGLDEDQKPWLCSKAECVQIILLEPERIHNSICLSAVYAECVQIMHATFITAYVYVCVLCMLNVCRSCMLHPSQRMCMSAYCVCYDLYVCALMWPRCKALYDHCMHMCRHTQTGLQQLSACRTCIPELSKTALGLLAACLLRMLWILFECTYVATGWSFCNHSNHVCRRAQTLVMLRSCMLGLKCIHNSVYACMFDDLCVYAYDPAISSLWPCFSLFLFFQCCFGCYIMWRTFCFKYIGILNKCMYASHTCMSSFMHACARFSTCTKSGTSWVHTKRVWLLLGIMVQQFNDSFFVIQYVCMPVYLHAQSSMAASNWWG